jgi:HTH-type transcriptional regulator, glycine betaine synthesis regulator
MKSEVTEPIEATLPKRNLNRVHEMINVRSRSGEQLESEVRDETGLLSPTHWAIVDVCVRTAQVLGVPRSTGEIFGLIFCSPRPVSFDDVVRILKLSNGTTSHGLRYLKRLGAVRSCYVAQERKDFYVAETSLKKMMSSLFAENVITHLGGSAEHLERLRAAALPESGLDSNVLYCIDQMIGWNQQLRSAVIKGFESLR